MVSSGVWCPDGYCRVRHMLSEGNTALKLTLTAQYGEGTPGGALKSKFPTEDTKLISLPYLHFH